MTSSFLSIYSDSWTLSEPGNEHLLEIDATSSRTRSTTRSRISRAGDRVGLASELLEEYDGVRATLQAVCAIEPRGVAERSVRVLSRIAASMREQDVALTDCVIMHRYVWDAWDGAVLTRDETRFPLENVPVKCNVLQMLIAVVQEQHAGGTAKTEKVLEYLERLIGAWGSSGPAGAARQHVRNVSNVSDVLRPFQTGTGSSVVSSGSSEAGATGDARARRRASRASTQLLQNWFRAPKSRPTRKGSDSAGSLAATNNTAEEPTTPLAAPHRRQDLQSMRAYKNAISGLEMALDVLPRTRDNAMVFEFVDTSVNTFLLGDCKLLLRQYIRDSVLAVLA
ncbi:LAMI_0D04984g1_1 [Lachancea mirantina]|uniref:LAMI_0D04984g1_1 n=1 Tax=Lachancea mirantina TaxID=1230905 RepID=A0A1G4JBH0_9SACH|nr:LAMI_0D04984g1_1 [Lachancea mirantina]